MMVKNSCQVSFISIKSIDTLCKCSGASKSSKLPSQFFKDFAFILFSEIKEGGGEERGVVVWESERIEIQRNKQEDIKKNPMVTNI